MKYHNITKDDMNNGDGLRVVLWVSGCNHYCDGCHNKITWDANCGLEFDENAENEIFELLNKDYISGLTLSGGDPLNINNVHDIAKFISKTRTMFPNKTIWLYTGYTWENIKGIIAYSTLDDLVKSLQCIMSNIDILVDGKFEKDKADVNYHWCGSTNQRVINVQESLAEGDVVLHE